MHMDEVGPAAHRGAQRPVAGARSRAAHLRAAPRAAQHPGVAAEPRRHQARGRHGPRASRSCLAGARSPSWRARELVAVDVPELHLKRRLRLGLSQDRRPLARRARVPARGPGA
ncbi:MAG: hypothetical protein MZV64_43425 [Ignavibacteriales bacterium]|nr:hypothetical protein [Ignavibacteriales bacterium]